MLYYEYRGYTLCSCEELPYRHLAALPQEGEVLYLFERPLMIGRDTFPVTDAALLTAEEGVQTLRLLARNMAWMLKCFAAGKAAGVAMPAPADKVRTNFIRG